MMIPRFCQTWHLAALNLLRNRRRALTTWLVISLASAALLIAGGFTHYTYESLQEGAARDTGHVTLAHPMHFSHDEDVPLQYGLHQPAPLIRQLEEDTRVRRVLPRIALSGLISNGDKSMVFVGTGADIPGEAAVRGPFLDLRAGELVDGDNPDGLPRVLLGEALAKSLKAQPGSGLTLLATTTDGGMNAIDVDVAGIVSTGWLELDKRLVYLGLASAQRLLATQKVSTLAVVLEDTNDTAAFVQQWQNRDPGHRYHPWWEQAAYYHAVRALYDRIFGLLGLIIGALVFFSVANTLAMAVVERTREIGTLRALGAQPGEVVGGFIREGVLLGVAGSLSGMLMSGATSLALLVFDVSMPPPPGRSVGYPLHIDADPLLYASTLVGIVSLCLLAAWLASHRAARRSIVEALAHV